MANPCKNISALRPVVEQQLETDQEELVKTSKEMGAIFVPTICQVLRRLIRQLLGPLIRQVEEPLEADLKVWVAMSKNMSGIFIPAAVTIIATAMSNQKPSDGPISFGELILRKTGMAFTLFSFIIWATLIISVELPKIEKKIIIGSMIMGVFTFVIGFVLLARSEAIYFMIMGVFTMVIGFVLLVKSV